MKLVSYNIHRCLGRDRRIDPQRVLRVLQETEGDVIALQEVPLWNKRGAEFLKMVIAATGHVEVKYCNQCPNEPGCDLAPRARELARIISSQWVKTRSGLPSKATAILYLEYSFEPHSSIVRYGHYDWQRRQFIEHGSGEATPKDLVIAWMPIPELPAEIREEQGLAGLPGAYSEEHLRLD